MGARRGRALTGIEAGRGDASERVERASPVKNRIRQAEALHGTMFHIQRSPTPCGLVEAVGTNRGARVARRGRPPKHRTHFAKTDPSLDLSRGRSRSDSLLDGAFDHGRRALKSQLRGLRFAAPARTQASSRAGRSSDDPTEPRKAAGRVEQRLVTAGPADQGEPGRAAAGGTDGIDICGRPERPAMQVSRMTRVRKSSCAASGRSSGGAMEGAVDVAITAKAAVMASGSTTSSSAFRILQ